MPESKTFFRAIADSFFESRRREARREIRRSDELLSFRSSRNK